MKHAGAFLVLVSWVAGASADGWDQGSSIPVRAAIEPAVADLTLPLPPGAVVIGGVPGERVRAHTWGRVGNIDEAVLLAGFRQRPGSHPWMGEHVGKWLHAASLLWLHSSEPGLRDHQEPWQWRLHAREPDHADWCTAPGAGWREALDFEGSRYPGIVAKIFDGLPLAGLEPTHRAG